MNSRACDHCEHSWDRHNIYGCLHRDGEHQVPMAIPGYPDFTDTVYDPQAPHCTCGAAFGGDPARIAQWILIGANA